MKIDQELKLALAKLLPDQIEVFPLDEGEPWFLWTKGKQEIRDTEWDNIVRQVEQKMTGKTILAYARALMVETGSTPSLFHASAELVCGVACFNFACASWQTRARAIAKVHESNEKFC